jgi:AcrR family transcriptional regulator
MSVIAPSTKEQIVLAAERLFAEHGIDGVSLRQIGAAAGNGNNSAVQYHFGSKDRLVRAIFEYRLPRLRERRELLIAEHRPADLRSWVACLVRWMLEQSELDGSFFQSFVAMLNQYGRRDAFAQVPESFLSAMRVDHDQLASYLDHIVEPLRTHRITQARVLTVHVAADRERARATGRPTMPVAVGLSDLVDGMVGFLEAPVSAASREALETTDRVRVTAPAIG